MTGSERPATNDRWHEFLADEVKWAKAGSGMTRDQITGAAMFDAWEWSRSAEARDSRLNCRCALELAADPIPWARCEKCGQKLVAEEDGDAYCLNCETCDYCHDVHHMGDRCQEATVAGSHEMALQQAVETEWYNGNMDEGARDRILKATE